MNGLPSNPMCSYYPMVLMIVLIVTLLVLQFKYVLLYLNRFFICLYFVRSLNVLRLGVSFRVTSPCQRLTLDGYIKRINTFH